MKIGFHYHIPVQITTDGLYTRSFYGLFLDSIAKQCNQLIIFSYEPTVDELASINYKLVSGNINLISLGKHSSLPSRVLKFPGALFKIWGNRFLFDVLLVRSPTPLVIPISYLPKKIPVVLYLVGDYIEGSKNLKFGKIKNSLIKLLARLVAHSQRKLIAGNRLIVNSQALLNQFKSIARHTILIKSTTLSDGDFFVRDGILPHDKYKLLYTGRIDESKGLWEILGACKLLRNRGVPVEFHFAGLIVKGKENLPDKLLESCIGSAMDGAIFYHGLKKVGDELNQLYRSCDLYIIGSKSDFEGFPRTIWEAMANSLPVLASPVGSIGFFLRDGIEALHLKNVDPESIAQKVEYLINSPEVTKTIVRNGFLLAKENTLDNQASKIVEELNVLEKG